MQPLPPSHVRQDIPPTFDAVVIRCLEKAPEHRFQSVQELMAALRPFMTTDVPVLVPSVPPPNVARADAAADLSTAVLAKMHGIGEQTQVLAPVGLTQQGGGPIDPTRSSSPPGQTQVSAPVGLTQQGGGPIDSTRSSSPPGQTVRTGYVSQPGAVPVRQTNGGAAGKKDNKGLLVVAATVAVVGLVGGVMFIVTRQSGTPVSTDAAPIALPSGIRAATSAAAVPKDIVPETATPVSTTSNASNPPSTSAQPLKLTPSDRPVSTSTSTKKTSIPDFND